jgi:hypothetical protein
LKVARNATGRRCNRFEADLWARTTPARRDMLCPVLARLPFGLAICMPRAQPLSEDEAEHLRNARGFPDWITSRRTKASRSNTRLPIGGGCRTVDSSRWTIRRRLWWARTNFERKSHFSRGSASAPTVGIAQAVARARPALNRTCSCRRRG